MALLGALGATLAIAAILVVASPIGTLISARLQNGKSNDVRSSTSAIALQDGLASPLLGYGDSRRMQGGTQFITTGRSSSCKKCGNSEVGTSGQAQLLLVTSGIAGVVLYCAFFLYGIWRYRHDRTPTACAGCSCWCSASRSSPCTRRPALRLASPCSPTPSSGRTTGRCATVSRRPPRRPPRCQRAQRPDRHHQWPADMTDAARAADPSMEPVPVADPVVIYIAGSGRSGSTMLERALGEMPGFVNVGELIDLFRHVARQGERCGCGELVRRLPVLDQRRQARVRRLGHRIGSRGRNAAGPGLPAAAHAPAARRYGWPAAISARMSPPTVRATQALPGDRRRGWRETTSWTRANGRSRRWRWPAPDSMCG